MLFNAGGGADGTDLLLEITFKPARHGEQLFETLAGEQGHCEHSTYCDSCDSACVSCRAYGLYRAAVTERGLVLHRWRDSRTACGNAQQLRYGSTLAGQLY